MGGAQVGVPERRLDVGVAENLLNLLEGRAAHDHVACSRVPQVMEPEALDTGILKRLGEGGTDLPPRAGIPLGGSTVSRRRNSPAHCVNGLLTVSPPIALRCRELPM